MHSNGQAELYREMVFDEPVKMEVPVKIGSHNFVLRKLSAGDVVRYRNMMFRANRVDMNSRTASIEGWADTDVYLLTISMVELTERGEKRVTKEMVNSWDHGTVRRLVTRAQLISQVDADENEEDLLLQKADLERRINELQDKRTKEERVKNERDATPVG